MQPSIEHIVATYRPLIYQICAGFTNDPGLADDLTQETLVQVWRRLPTFRGDAKLSTWIYRITVNLCLMDKRKARPASGDLTETTAIAAPESPGPNEAALHLRRAITRLPRRQRAVVLLHLEELSHQDVGQVLGLTENNVGVLLHRAKGRLRELLTPITKTITS